MQQALTESHSSTDVSANKAAGAYSATLTVRNSTTGCVSTGIAITVNVVALPTITLSAAPNPSDVCFDALNPSTSSLSYTATTGSPNQYSIDFNAAANTAGLVDVVNAALTASPIGITVPANTAAGAYSATLTVRNNTLSLHDALPIFTVNVVALPTITLSAAPNPSDVCFDALNPSTSSL